MSYPPSTAAELYDAIQPHNGHVYLVPYNFRQLPEWARFVRMCDELVRQRLARWLTPDHRMYPGIEVLWVPREDATNV